MATVQQVVDDAREQYGISQNLPADMPATIVDLLNSTVTQSPDAPAFSALGCTLSYRQLNTLSDSFASYLQNSQKPATGRSHCRAIAELAAISGSGIRRIESRLDSG